MLWAIFHFKFLIQSISEHSNTISIANEYHCFGKVLACSFLHFLNMFFFYKLNKYGKDIHNSSYWNVDNACKLLCLWVIIYSFVNLMDALLPNRHTAHELLDRRIENISLIFFFFNYLFIRFELLVKVIWMAWFIFASLISTTFCDLEFPGELIS